MNLQGLEDATAVTLNYAPIGQLGPAVYLLQRVPGQPDHWSVKTLLREPESAGGHGWYLNVQTPSHPDGELRGQWSTQVNGWRDEFGLTVWEIDPPDGSTIASLPAVITMRFNRDILAESVTQDTVSLLASGGDAGFNEGNEWPIAPVEVSSSGATMIVTLDPSAGPEDVYQLRVRSVHASDGGQGLDSPLVATFSVDAAVAAPSFVELQEEILTPDCAQAGCHSGPRPALGLDLSEGAAFASMVSVASAEEPRLDLVEPGNQHASYVVRKLFQPQWDPHPAGLPALSNASMQMIRRWIDDGAQDN